MDSSAGRLGEEMKDRILTGWHAQRWLRLVFAVVFLAAGITRQEPVAWFAAIFFGIQAVFDVGCCGSVGCTSSRIEPTGTLDVEVNYEEIKDR
ncbi:MAG: hypothetical protein R2818_02940 [Flavobacteriales bacterium]